MKNKYIKFNIIFISILIIFSQNIFSAEIIYSPGSGTDQNALSPVNDPELIKPNAVPSDNYLSEGQISEIQKLQISSQTAAPTVSIVAESVLVPTAPSEYNVHNSQQNTIAQPYISFSTISQINIVQNNIYNWTTYTNTTSTQTPTLNSPAHILVNTSTGHIYSSKAMDEKFEPAGLVNLMTAYLGVQHFNMTDTLKVQASALKNIDKDAAIAALRIGDKITLKDAIASMFVKGCVDSANVIAENVSGNITEFVTLMNTTATSLGMQNTTFTNPSGINDEKQLSTTRDMAILLSKVAENKDLSDLLKLSVYTLPKTEKREQLTLYSKNSLLIPTSSHYNADIKASRMGYNSKSKYCIASLMQYKNQNIIAVVLKAEGIQFSDTKKLFDFGKIIADTEQTN